MDIMNTVMALGRSSELLAWRPQSVVIRVSPRLVVERTLVARPYRWAPAFADYIAGDWQLGTIDQLMQIMRAAETVGEKP